MDPETAATLGLTKEDAAGLFYTAGGDGFLSFASLPATVTISFGAPSPLRLLVETTTGQRPLDALAAALDALEADGTGDPALVAAAVSAWRACRAV
jgi:hypothetical protein